MDEQDSAYLTYAGEINQATVGRLFNAIAIASQQKQNVHLMLQSTGGMVSDGIALYNVFASSPVDLTLYNVGGVSSIAAIAFLGAKTRLSSAHGVFMFHRPYSNPQPGQRDLALAAITKGLSLDDARTAAIMRGALTLSNEQWELYEKAELHLSASEALQASLIHRIAEFSPPTGSQVFNL